MKRMITLAFTLLVIQYVHAQQGYLKSKEEVAKYSEKVVMHFKDKKFTEAFEELRKYWPIAENELAQLESQTIKQFNMVGELYGNTIGAEFVRDKLVNDFILRKIFVIKFEKHIIRVQFTYYKNDNGWMLNGFKWDDHMDELFD